MSYSRLLAVLLLMPVVALADWKYAGTAMLGSNVDESIFYDTGSIARPSKSIVRTWIKTIPQDAIEAFYTKPGALQRYKELVSTKVARGYVPGYLQLPVVTRLYPSAQGQTLNGAIIVVTGAELIANAEDVQASAKFYFEIDCYEKTMATLSAVIFRPNGSISSQGDAKSPKGRRISPGGLGDGLSQILCLH